MKLKYKAIFFDVDGTLLDTTEYIYRAFEYTLNRHFKPIGRTEIKKLMGKPLAQCYEILTRSTDVKIMLDDHDAFQIDNPSLSTPFPCTIFTLSLLKERGYKIAAITTRSKKSALDTLKRNDIYQYLDFFVAFEDVINPKPHPEPLQKALDFFSLHPSDVLMVGDTEADILAGRNAEVKTVGALYGFEGNSLKMHRPDFVIDSIDNLFDILS